MTLFELAISCYHERHKFPLMLAFILHRMGCDGVLAAVERKIVLASECIWSPLERSAFEQEIGPQLAVKLPRRPIAEPNSLKSPGFGGRNRNFRKRKGPPTEINVRLSQSVLWERSNNFYEGAGMAAFENEDVPFAITSTNVFVGKYADVAGNFLQSKGKDAGFFLDVGSGHGKFAVKLARSFRERRISYTVIMSDFHDSIIQCMLSESFPHAQEIENLVKEGFLDFALFDAWNSEIESLNLIRSGKVVSIDEVDAFSCNYVLDSLPCDVLNSEGKFLSVTSWESSNGIDFSFLEKSPSFPVDLKIEDKVLFPTFAIDFLRRIHDVHDSEMLVFVADKVVDSRGDPFVWNGVPGLDRHGSDEFHGLSAALDVYVLGEALCDAYNVWHSLEFEQAIGISVFVGKGNDVDLFRLSEPFREFPSVSDHDRLRGWFGDLEISERSYFFSNLKGKADFFSIFDFDFDFIAPHLWSLDESYAELLFKAFERRFSLTKRSEEQVRLNFARWLCLRGHKDASALVIENVESEAAVKLREKLSKM